MDFHSQDIISGNLTISISDHMVQFVQNPNRSKKNDDDVTKIFKRCYKRLKKDDFVKDIQNINWPQIDNDKDNDDPNDFIVQILQIFDDTLYKHAPMNKQ